MLIRKKLQTYFDSQRLPEQIVLLELLEKFVNTLENETDFYRPTETIEKIGKKVALPGGLLDFSKIGQLPVIVIPDLHARRNFLLDVLDYKIANPSEKDTEKSKLTILECLEQKLIYVVCLGDFFHSEARGAERWFRAYKDFKNGNFIGKAMSEEMIENLNLLLMLSELKYAFNENFHCLKGNHENVTNEYGNGNLPFYKFADEGNMFHGFLEEFYSDALIYLWSAFEHSLPICAVFKNVVISHAEPAFAFSRSEIINYRKNPSVILGLTWTANGEAEIDSVRATIKNLFGKNKNDVFWLSGHRPVKGKYELRQNGALVQFHNPAQENIAFVRVDKKFEADKDIISVDGDFCG